MKKLTYSLLLCGLILDGSVHAELVERGTLSGIVTTFDSDNAGVLYRNSASEYWHLTRGGDAKKLIANSHSERVTSVSPQRTYALLRGMEGIHIVKLKTGEKIPIKFKLNFSHHATWLLDESKFAFVSRNKKESERPVLSNFTENLYLFNVIEYVKDYKNRSLADIGNYTTKLTTYTKGFWIDNLAWATDQKRLAFGTYHPEKVNNQSKYFHTIEVVDISSEMISTVAKMPSDGIYWTGKDSLAFFGYTKAGGWTLYAKEGQGPVKQLVQGRPHHWAFSEQERSYLYDMPPHSSNPGNEHFWKNLDNKSMTRIVGALRNPMLSKDGKWLSFQVPDTLDKAMAILVETKLISERAVNGTVKVEDLIQIRMGERPSVYDVKSSPLPQPSVTFRLNDVQANQEFISYELHLKNEFNDRYLRFKFVNQQQIAGKITDATGNEVLSWPRIVQPAVSAFLVGPHETKVFSGRTSSSLKPGQTYTVAFELIGYQNIPTVQTQFTVD